ncbi:hypothetical protein [Aeromicrobium sp. UC242_57]|uniref:hypothetical protein n=1 Tax=Aeromicrobium sp. UC242_57 TaxID=3374624 RepID=UPI003788B141
MVPAAVLVWAATAGLVTGSGRLAVAVGLVAAVTAAALLRWRVARPVALAAVCLAAVATSCGWRLTMVEHSPLSALAAQHRLVTMDVEVLRDARTFVSFRSAERHRRAAGPTTHGLGHRRPAARSGHGVHPGRGGRPGRRTPARRQGPHRAVGPTRRGGRGPRPASRARRACGLVVGGL